MPGSINVVSSRATRRPEIEVSGIAARRTGRFRPRNQQRSSKQDDRGILGHASECATSIEYKPPPQSFGAIVRRPQQFMSVDPIRRVWESKSAK